MTLNRNADVEAIKAKISDLKLQKVKLMNQLELEEKALQQQFGQNNNLPSLYSNYQSNQMRLVKIKNDQAQLLERIRLIRTSAQEKLNNPLVGDSDSDDEAEASTLSVLKQASTIENEIQSTNSMLDFALQAFRASLGEDQGNLRFDACIAMMSSIERIKQKLDKVNKEVFQLRREKYKNVILLADNFLASSSAPIINTNNTLLTSSTITQDVAKPREIKEEEKKRKQPSSDTSLPKQPESIAMVPVIIEDRSTRMKVSHSTSNEGDVIMLQTEEPSTDSSSLTQANRELISTSSSSSSATNPNLISVSDTRFSIINLNPVPSLSSSSAAIDPNPAAALSSSASTINPKPIVALSSSSSTINPKPLAAPSSSSSAINPKPIATSSSSTSTINPKPLATSSSSSSTINPKPLAAPSSSSSTTNPKPIALPSSSSSSTILSVMSPKTSTTTTTSSSSASPYPKSILKQTSSPSSSNPSVSTAAPKLFMPVSTAGNILAVPKYADMLQYLFDFIIGRHITNRFLKNFCTLLAENHSHFDKCKKVLTKNQEDLSVDPNDKQMLMDALKSFLNTMLKNDSNEARNELASFLIMLINNSESSSLSNPCLKSLSIFALFELHTMHPNKEWLKNLLENKDTEKYEEEAVEEFKTSRPAGGRDSKNFSNFTSSAISKLMLTAFRFEQEGNIKERNRVYQSASRYMESEIGDKIFDVIDNALTDESKAPSQHRTLRGNALLSLYCYNMSIKLQTKLGQAIKIELLLSPLAVLESLIKIDMPRNEYYLACMKNHMKKYNIEAYLTHPGVHASHKSNISEFIAFIAEDATSSSSSNSKRNTK